MTWCEKGRERFWCGALDWSEEGEREGFGMACGNGVVGEGEI